MTDAIPTPPVPRWLHAWAVLTVCAAVPLALLGAETTTRGVGMADQVSLRSPLYFFSLDLRDTPFGLLIEHGHRLFGWAVGLCCIVLAFGLTIGGRSWLRGLGWVALVMVAAQGIFGILRVRYNALAGPELAAFHGCFAQLTFATLVVVAVLCSRAWSLPTITPPTLRIGGLILSVVVFTQIVFGAITRHLFDPLAQRLHILLAFVVLGMIFWLHGRLQRHPENLAARYTMYFLTVLVFIQPILGVEAWMRRFGSGSGAELPELVVSNPTLAAIRSAHHLLGTLIFTTTAALAAYLCRPTRIERTAPIEDHSEMITAIAPMPANAITTRQLEGSI